MYLWEFTSLGFIIAKNIPRCKALITSMSVFYKPPRAGTMSFSICICRFCARIKSLFPDRLSRSGKSRGSGTLLRLRIFFWWISLDANQSWPLLTSAAHHPAVQRCLIPTYSARILIRPDRRLESQDRETGCII